MTPIPPLCPDRLYRDPHRHVALFSGNQLGQSCPECGDRGEVEKTEASA